ncbi:hypothetical protein VCR19J5_600170 [Vibrio crassostreae]|nr:hypothetical protein VCR19J5_600170 [Vibrio crassostreae]
MIKEYGGQKGKRSKTETKLRE